MNNESITIMTTGGGHNYTIDRGDGNTDVNVTGNISHSYALSGTHIIAIQGDFPHIYFNGIGSKEKIIEINQWGGGNWSSKERAFFGCTNLSGQASDNPDLSLVEGMSYMSFGCASFNQAIGNWNTSNVENMSCLFSDISSFNQYIGGWDTGNVWNMREMFYNASAFTQDISAWNVGNVQSFIFTFYHPSAFNQAIGNWNTENGTHFFNMFDRALSFDQNIANWDVSNAVDMTNMFKGVTLSSANYDLLLQGWSTQVVQSGTYCSGGNSQYCTGDTAKTNLIAINGWNFIDGGRNCPGGLDPFVTTWLTTTTNENIIIPRNRGGFHYHVDWGDGNITNAHTGNTSHIYTDAGNYTVKIYGDFPKIHFNNTGSKNKIISVDQWVGTWKSMAISFMGCNNLSDQASDVLDLSEVTDMSRMLYEANSWNQEMSLWDVGNVEVMTYMFYNATSFNQDIGAWDTGEVVNMREMFYKSTAFNQDLSNRDVGQVSSFIFIFYQATSFYQNLGARDISSISSMIGMLDNSGLCINNYESTLAGWESQGFSTIALGSIKMKYCDPTARNTLINSLGWIINGDILDCSETNTWIGGSVVGRYDSVNNWSQGHFPIPCETTVIPVNVTLNFGAADSAIIRGINISNGASLMAPAGALINVKTD
ncbi:MAG: surface protein [Halioglobus sp.]|jgi:surface protein